MMSPGRVKCIESASSKQQMFHLRGQLIPPHLAVKTGYCSLYLCTPVILMLLLLLVREKLTIIGEGWAADGLPSEMFGMDGDEYSIDCSRICPPEVKTEHALWLGVCWFGAPDDAPGTRAAILGTPGGPSSSEIGVPFDEPNDEWRDECADAALGGDPSLVDTKLWLSTVTKDIHGWMDERETPITTSKGSCQQIILKLPQVKNCIQNIIATCNWPDDRYEA